MATHDSMAPNSASGASSPTAHGDDALTFDTTAARCRQTSQRRQATDADAFIPKPAIARANLAVSTAAPDGSPESRGQRMRQHTVLQQHVLFWDRDGDGQIYPWDTYVGFRDLGFNVLFSLLATVVINGNFSYPTRLAVSWWPDPLFRVYVGGIHKAKHGSDSGTYDKEGRFLPQMFEDMFSKWDVHRSGSLSGRELWHMIKGNRLAADPFGWGAAIFEFGTTWLLLQKDGRVSKEDLRQTYDGTIFWKIKEAREHGKGWDKGFWPSDLVALGQRRWKAHDK
ncbi:Caleosin related protein-domain-containing protein [Chaetomidium leptoderma]|uniref:Caleosin related protein-domain-containing protein n=1 Tax=Chaetomidium leptoderma TaxID=669021 RepID=A0AAN6VJW1_9PEZI|nr:Caleosin related protein-domain-containing protein [Chaetomidium leptoderma]